MLQNRKILIIFLCGVLLLVGFFTAPAAKADPLSVSTWEGLCRVLCDPANKNGTVKLSGNITWNENASGFAEVPVGQVITLDLAGYTLDRGLSGSTAQEDGYVIANCGTLTVTDSRGGGRITGGSNSGNGGGIFNSGWLTVSGGTISGNKTAKWGGGIYLAQNSTLVMTGGAVTDNICGQDGGGIYVPFGVNVNVYGNPVVSYNKNTTGDRNNISLDFGVQMGVTDRITDGANLYVHKSGSYATDDITYRYANNNTDHPARFFHADDSRFGTSLTGGEVVFDDQVVNHVPYIERGWSGSAVTTSNTFADEARLIPADGNMDGGWYYLNRNVTVTNRISISDSVHLILGDRCTLDVRGLFIPEGKTLYVYGQSDGEGSGKLNSHPSAGAGIGAYSGHKGGNFVMHSGTVEAHGANHCAGIGSNDGDETRVGAFTMYGGEVKAYGGSSGAGVGGGRASEGGVITIYGGTLTATGDHYGAGIGGGNGQDKNPLRGAHAGKITINGGVVTAMGGDDGAGIGGGEGGNAGTIIINGGTVKATGGNNSAGIGCGEGETTGKGGSVTINGGTVTAKGGDDGAGIGGGEDGYCTITINGGTVTAYSGRQAAAIGGGNNANSGDITITGGTVTAIADSDDGRGIGSGYDTNNSTKIFLGREAAQGNNISVTASSVNGNVELKQKLHSDNGNFNTGTVPNVPALGGNKTLTPWDGISGGFTYLDPYTGLKTYTGAYSVVTKDTLALYSGWYVVKGSVTISQRVTVNGNVNLVLADNSKLNVKKGITVNIGGTRKLTIWSQSTGDDQGQLTAKDVPEEHAAIGGGIDRPSAGIVIHGGNIDVKGGKNAAGIGTGYWCTDYPDDIIIDGGKITARAGTTDGEQDDILAHAGGIGAAFHSDRPDVYLGYGPYTRSSVSINASWNVYFVKFRKPYQIGDKLLTGQHNYVDSKNKDSFYEKTIRAQTWDGNINSWTDLQMALNTYDTVTLTKDITAGSDDQYLYVETGRTVILDLNGWTVSRGLTKEKGSGYVIRNEGTLTIRDGKGGGKIKGGFTSGDGGGIHNYGELTISGGTVTENSAKGSGGGILNAGTLNLNGGSVTGNTANAQGGGILQGGTMNVSGAPSVTGNTAGDGANIFLRSGHPVMNVSGILAQGAVLGVTAETGTGAVTSGYAAAGNSEPVHAIVPDREDYYLTLENGEVLLCVDLEAIVTFDSDGGTAIPPLTVQQGSAAPEPAEAPEKEGYLFAGWFAVLDGSGATAGEPYDFSQTVESDITLKAKWIQAVRVFFDSDGGSETETQIIALGTQAAVPETPAKKYHTFGGWFAVTDEEGTTADEAYDFTLPVESDITLKARWTLNHISVEFDSNGGTAVETQTVPQGSAAEEPDTPVQEGFAFVGWFRAVTDEQTQQETLAETAFDFSLPVLENTRLKALWTKINFQVAFDSNGGSAVETQTVPQGTAAQEPEDPVQEGFAFVGWFRVITGAQPGDETLDETAFDFSMPITENTQLKAAWTRDTVSVTFDSDGGTPVSTQTIPRGGTAAEPKAPARDGYEFEGWFRVLTAAGEVTLSETAFDFEAPVTEDISVRAVWNRKCTVRFNPGSETATGEMPEETVDADSDFILPDCGYSVEGKTFAEWAVQIGEQITYRQPGDVIVILNDTTVTVTWADNHTITFLPGEGDASGTMEPGMAAEGSDFILPEPGFSNEGKVFMYWLVTTGDETLKRMPGDDFTVPDDAVVTAVWGYTVTFDGGDGSTGTMESVIVRAGTQFSLPSCDFEKEGTKFREWSVQIGTDEAVRNGIDDEILITGNTTISAVWMDTAASPVLSPSAGTYNNALNVTIICATQGAEIRYTVDGSDPAAGGILYTGAIAVEETTTVRAIAMKEKMMNSPVSEATYKIIPAFGPVSFTLPEDTTVLEESAFEGVTGMTVVDASRCRKIGRWVFRGSGIIQIRLPAECDINDEAFADCGRVLVFAPAGGSTEQYCRSAANPCVFIGIGN